MSFHEPRLLRLHCQLLLCQWQLAAAWLLMRVSSGMLLCHLLTWSLLYKAALRCSPQQRYSLRCCPRQQQNPCGRQCSLMGSQQWKAWQHQRQLCAPVARDQLLLLPAGFDAADRARIVQRSRKAVCMIFHLCTAWCEACRKAKAMHQQAAGQAAVQAPAATPAAAASSSITRSMGRRPAPLAHIPSVLRFP